MGAAGHNNSGKGLGGYLVSSSKNEHASASGEVGGGDRDQLGVMHLLGVLWGSFAFFASFAFSVPHPRHLFCISPPAGSEDTEGTWCCLGPLKGRWWPFRGTLLGAGRTQGCCGMVKPDLGFRADFLEEAMPELETVGVHSVGASAGRRGCQCQCGVGWAEDVRGAESGAGGGERTAPLTEASHISKELGL